MTDDYVTEQAKMYGLDLTTAREDADGALRADICLPKTTGYWEYKTIGWVHMELERVQ